MKISNGNDILPAIPLYIAIADDDINYNLLILKTTVIGITNDINPARNIVIISHNENLKEINLAEVTNQPTWTNDLAGSLIAITDIASWVADSVPIDVTPIDVNSMPSNTLATGVIAANGEIVSILVPPGASSIGLQVTGTWVGQLEFEATVDDTNYVSVYASNNSGNSTNATQGNGIFILPGGGFIRVRTRASAWSSGLSNIFFNASIGQAGTVITAPIPAGTNNIGDVDVLSIAAGDNNIGNVDIVTMPPVTATDLDIRNLVFSTDKADVSGSSGVGVTGTFFQATQPVSATNLDTRDLVFATDKVDVSGSTIAAVVAATDLDIRDLVFATDKVDVTGSIITAVVSATDLDIRNLVFATDKVDVSGSTGVGVTGAFFQATQPVSAIDLDIRNLVFATDKVDASGTTLGANSGIDIGDVTINNAAGASAVNIQDGGNSITVDGVFFQATQPISAVSLPLPTGAATAALQTQPGVDIGDVTVNNAAGAAAVNIQDGGNSITVDGTVTANAGTNLNTSALNLEATQADVRTALQIIDDWDETDRAKVNPIVGQAGVQGGSGAVSANTQRVVLATDVALPAGTNNIGDVDILSIVPGTAATNLGKAEDVAHTTGDTGVMALGVSNEGGTALVNANGDYTPIATDKMGQIYVNPENNKVLFRGRSASFRTLGRAGTAGQKILAIHNATGSSITVKVNKIVVDMWCTVVKVITVAPPIVRIWKFTAVPTNGTTLTKNKIGGTTTSNASAVVWNDSSADGTGSGTTLTVTLPAGTILDQKVAPRVITGAGEISISALEFHYPNGIQLAPLEGVCVFLDYTLATQNPVTDMWAASVEWEESTT